VARCNHRGSEALELKACTTFPESRLMRASAALVGLGKIAVEPGDDSTVSCVGVPLIEVPVRGKR
jgi:hypothetical protein